ncbi:hypothetical protein LPJ61_001444 [Coemansia biformis]|uniref:ARM repeat-containing protein n=1 Tax=Coemansia biformis TaxID=1286918 RepID=A0A9W7YGP5_9FUNG|nr:hypothetical protein LPJ61_001444 [Coemansia biformis]
MSAKRGYPETSVAQRPAAQQPAAQQPAAETGAQPYRTYQEAHEALLSLRGLCDEDQILLTGRRALLTACAPGLPAAVQQVGVRLAAHLCAYPETDSAQMAGGLVRALEDADSSIRCEIYQVLIALHELKDAFATEHLAGVRRQLDCAVQSDLNDPQHRLRCAALSILPTIRPCAGPAAPGDTFDTLCRYSNDPHPKVRQTALSAILRQHMMGVALPVEMYDECVTATKDDVEQVRLVAAELVWAISSAYPEHPVVIEKFNATETIRLLDDAFVKTCDMVNDSSVVVRQRASTILRRFKGVDNRFLSQTFSKQVMSHLRRVVPTGARGYMGRNLGLRGARPKATSRIPEGDASVESDEIRLLDSGAAGAFVHALEDEFQEVRDAAIESITELSFASSEFAAKAVDFLVDMFNDSSDRVRLCAIRALVAIGTRAPIKLTEEQLAIALSAMKDSSRSVRGGIYEFLTVSALASSGWLEKLMAGFTANLERYPEDQLAIYKVLKALGRSHSPIISTPFVRALLGISEHYLSREARIDDTVYAGSVILIMNTQPSTRQAMAGVLPDYVFSHLPYLCDKYPGCMPQDIAASVPARLAFVRQMIERPCADAAIAQLSLADGRQRVAEAYLAVQELLAEARGRGDACAGSLEARFGQRLREFALLRAGPLGGLVACSQAAVASYAELAAEVLRAQSVVDGAVGRQGLVGLAARIMYGAYAIEARTLGLDPCSVLALAYTRVFAHAIWLSVHTLAQRDPRLVDKMQAELRQRATRVLRALRQRSLAAPELDGLADALAPPAVDGAAGCSVPVLEQALAAFVAGFRPLSFAPAGCCQYARARLSCTHPARRAIEFNHLFPLDLSVSAELEWIAHRRDVLVVVRLPTQRSIALRPPPAALRPGRPLHWTLEWADIPVALPLGSGESTSVELSVALQHAVDAPWTDARVVSGTPVPESYTVADYYRSMGSAELRHVRIEIADQSHAIAVSPIEFRPQASVHTRG